MAIYDHVISCLQGGINWTMKADVGTVKFPERTYFLSYCGNLFNKGEYNIYRVSQEECEILRESVLYVKLYRYNPKHLYPKLNGHGDNGQRSLKL